jgi:hypothetical protein
MSSNLKTPRRQTRATLLGSYEYFREFYLKNLSLPLEELFDLYMTKTGKTARWSDDDIITQILFKIRVQGHKSKMLEEAKCTIEEKHVIMSLQRRPIINDTPAQVLRSTPDQGSSSAN